MAFHVYILQSVSTGKKYIGHTGDLERRLREHNDPSLGSLRYTRKQKGPWKLIFSEEAQTRGEAMKRETFLKSVKGREWIKEKIKPLVESARGSQEYI